MARGITAHDLSMGRVLRTAWRESRAPMEIRVSSRRNLDSTATREPIQEGFCGCRNGINGIQFSLDRFINS
jgi:hypothetical protein